MAEETLEKYFPNMDYVIGNGDGDPVTQSALIDDYIARGIDVLVIDPVEKEAMVPAFERLKRREFPWYAWTAMCPRTLNPWSRQTM